MTLELKVPKLTDWLMLIACNLIWAGQLVLAKLVQRAVGQVALATLPAALDPAFRSEHQIVRHARNAVHHLTGMLSAIVPESLSVMVWRSSESPERGSM